MSVSDFDSNGLIFALFGSKNLEQGDLYRLAIRNIIDAQGFDILPLVDGPRIRDNVNDMTARAIYAENGGNITHLAQRSGDSVELFSLDQILTEKEDAPIFKSLQRLCTHIIRHPSTPFVFLVVDSNENPTAVFTLRELRSKRLNDAILSTYLGYSGLKSGKVEERSKAIHELLKLFLELQSVYDMNWREINIHCRDTSRIKSLCTEISKLLDLFSDAKISMPRRSESPPRADDAEVRLVDVMRHGAAGVIWEKNNRKVAELACELLCEANGFDYLVQYDSKNVPDSLNRSALMDKNGERNRVKGGYKEFDDMLFDSLDRLFLFDTPLFIAPSEEIQTGEGPLVWPSILSFEEVKNSHGALWLMKQIGDSEEHMRNLLPDREYKIKNYPIRREHLTLGQINRILSGRKNFDNDDVQKMQPENLFSKKILDWRNDFAHGMKNNALKLGSLTRQQITEAVRCCAAWKNMKKEDVHK